MLNREEVIQELRKEEKKKWKRLYPNAYNIKFAAQRFIVTETREFTITRLAKNKWQVNGAAIFPTFKEAKKECSNRYKTFLEGQSKIPIKERVMNLLDDN